MAVDFSDYLRKHRRVLFAALTVIAIFCFILGDAFMGRGAGANSGRRARGWFDQGGEPVAVIGGDRYDVVRIEDVGYDRHYLSQFLFEVYTIGQHRAYLALGFADREAAILPSLLQEEYRANMERRSLMMDPRVSQEVKDLLRRYQEVRGEGGASADKYNAAFRPKKEPISVGLLMHLRTTNFLSPLAIVDHLYWRRRADELGVVMPVSAVVEDLQNLAINKMDELELRTLGQGDRHSRRMNWERLLALVAGELRAMIARDLVHGNRQQNLLAQTTPFDAWDAYVQLKTQLDVSILPLPVMNKDFVSQVKDPTKAELKAFFDRYRNVLPDKNSPTPGFKIPRQYRIDLVYANLRVAQPARKYYEAWSEVIDALNPLGALAAQVAAYNQRQKEFIIHEQSEDFTVGSGAEQRLVRLSSSGALREDAQLVAQIVAAVGAAAATAPGSPAIGAHALPPGFRPVPEKEARVLEAAETLGRLWAASASGGILTSAAPKSRVLMKERPRPFEEVAGIIQYDRVEERCRQLLRADLSALGEQLQAYGKKYGEARAKWRASRVAQATPFVPPLFDEAKKQSLEDFLKEFTAKRGLTFAGMKQLRTEGELFDEKGDDTALTTHLLPLFAKAVIPLTEKQLKEFVARQLADPNRRLFDWQEIPSPPSWFELAIYWKADQTDERVPTFEEAEPTVRLAWLQEHARPFAEQAAKALAEEVLKQPDGVRILIDRPNFKIHETIARYRLAVNQAPGSTLSFETAPIPVVDPPPEGIVDLALEQLKKPNDHLIVWNQPKNTCYLIFLRQREEPDPASARDREQFDFQFIIPGQYRAPTVNGRSFADFVQAEKSMKVNAEWERFLKVHTHYNEKLAGEAAKALANLAQNL